MTNVYHDIIGDALKYNGAGIYQIRLLGTDRCYVGRSAGVGGRLYSHVSELLRKKHCNPKLQNAWNKHGADRFAFKVLENVEGKAIAEAEQYWINHFQAASIGLNIVALVDPYVPMDRSDPNVIKYRHALAAVALALKVAECAELRGNERRASLEDCLRWNAYAISMLSTVPAEMVKNQAKLRLDKALSYANGQINLHYDNTGEASFLPYIASPETFPHDASLPQADFDEIRNGFWIIVGEEWERAALKVTKQRAAEIAGMDEVERQWRSAPADGNFLEWCREIGVHYPPSSNELRAAGLVTWEISDP